MACGRQKLMLVLDLLVVSFKRSVNH